MLRASVLFGFAAADVGRMIERLETTLNGSRTSNLRAFTGNVENALVDLVDNHGGYGCWCYFYDDVGNGKGTPVDEIDSFCKVLNEGYECAIRDTEDEGASCVPWEIDYNPGLGVGQNLYQSCKDRNQDSMCKVRACAIEGHFTNNLVAILLSGSFMDYESFGHSDGFDASHDGGCPVKPGVKSSGDKNCCGIYRDCQARGSTWSVWDIFDFFHALYPSRFPYKNLDGDRACCGMRTYNTQLLNCCQNGQVKANC